MTAKKKKEEIWTIDFEKAKVVKLRANQDPSSTQSSVFDSKEAAIEKLKNVIERQISFLNLELDFYNKALESIGEE